MRRRSLTANLSLSYLQTPVCRARESHGELLSLSYMLGFVIPTAPAKTRRSPETKPYPSGYRLERQIGGDCTMSTYRNYEAYETLTDAISVAKPHHYIVAVSITRYLVITSPASLRSCEGEQGVTFTTVHRPLHTELILPSDDSPTTPSQDSVTVTH
jgi:hypothetical protein